jgi:hypothetical protein
MKPGGFEDKQPKIKFMKISVKIPAEIPEPRVFQIAIRRCDAKPQAAATNPKSKKLDNIYSRSCDIREDRGMREMNTSHNAQSFQRGH